MPLPAYWLILDLVENGKPEDEIVKDVMSHTGTKTHVVTEIVGSVAENQRLLVAQANRPKSSNPSSIRPSPSTI